MKHWPLVGREQELASVLGSRDTHCGAVVVGAAGVGKTRLAREAARKLSGAAAPVWIRASPLAMEALTNLSSGQPRVVIVDDAHMLDEPSAAYLYQLTCRREVFLLITVRCGVAIPQPLTSLWSDELMARVDLATLDGENMSALLRAVMGRIHAVSEQLLIHLCAGNPLLLRELLYAGQATGVLRQRLGLWRWSGEHYVTGRLEDVVRALLGELDPAMTDLAEVLAVAGQLPVPVVESIVGHEVVDRAGRRRIVLIGLSSRRLAARLSCPVYADVIRTAVPLPRQRRIWHQLAEALEATPMRRDDDVLAVATSRMKACLEAPPELFTRAAQLAADRLDYSLAVQLAEAACVPGGGAQAEPLLADRLVIGALGVDASGAECVALLSTGRPDEAARVAERGHADAVALVAGLGMGADPLVGMWCVLRGMVAKAQGRARSAIASLTEAAVSLDDWPALGFRRLCHAELAGAYALAGEVAQAQEWICRVDAEPPAAGAGRLLEAWLARDHAWVVAAMGDLAGAARNALSAADLAMETGQPAIEALALFDAARFGAAATVGPRLDRLARASALPVAHALAEAVTMAGGIADAAAAGRLIRAADGLAACGYLLYAVETLTAAHVAFARAGHRAQAQAALLRAADLLPAGEGVKSHRLHLTGVQELLTPRELQVAVLTASGRSSARVAAHLGLSVRTVDNYLGRVYVKLGISGRAELAPVFGADEPAGLGEHLGHAVAHTAVISGFVPVVVRVERVGRGVDREPGHVEGTCGGADNHYVPLMSALQSANDVGALVTALRW